MVRECFIKNKKDLLILSLHKKLRLTQTFDAFFYFHGVRHVTLLFIKNIYFTVMMVRVIRGLTNQKRVKNWPGIEVHREVPADITKLQVDINGRVAIPAIHCRVHLKLLISYIDKYFWRNFVHIQNIYIYIYIYIYI